MLGRPPTAALFPYTPLFRSSPPPCSACRWRRSGERRPLAGRERQPARPPGRPAPVGRPHERHVVAGAVEQPGDEAVRSEEHTSELQSRLHLVCRLLLEKTNV